MTTEQSASDAALLRALRRTWERLDPAPVGLIDRMVAAVAAADLSEEYALLTLVESDAAAAVRGDSDTLTLQFSDGTTTVLLHVTGTEHRVRRVDGWVDGAATTATLLQDDRETAVEVDAGRFAFDAVDAGMSRLRITLESGGGVLTTPRFEI